MKISQIAKQNGYSFKFKYRFADTLLTGLKPYGPATCLPSNPESVEKIKAEAQAKRVAKAVRNRRNWSFVHQST